MTSHQQWIPADWTFRSDAVAERFDKHVRESLPWYDLATFGTAHFVRCFLPSGGLVYDIGASTGNIGRAVADVLATRGGSLVAIETAQEMADLWNSPGTLVVADACDYEYEPFDVAVLFLTLMFIPVRKRRPLLDRLREFCRPGGVIIVVDKTPLPSGYLGSSIHRLTLAQKQAAGISSQEIAEKELSLSGVQRPLDNELGDGWTEWLRVGEFAGFIYEGRAAQS